MSSVTPLLLSLLLCWVPAGCRKSSSPAPPPPAPDNPVSVAPVRSPSLDAQEHPERTLLGTWEVSSVATLEANASQPEARLRELRGSVLPGMVGVIMTYEAGGKTTTRAGNAPPLKGTWKAVKVEPPRMTVTVTSPGAPPGTMNVEVVRADLIHTEMMGFVLALRRAGATTGERPTSAEAVDALPARRGGGRVAADMDLPGPAVDPGMSERNRRILEENKRVDAENMRVDERNKRVDEQNRKLEERNKKREVPLYVK